MPRVILIRHAESQAMVDSTALPEPRFGGRMNDVKLSEPGEEQARALGRYAKRRLPRPALVLASPARRAVQTYELCATVADLPPAEVDDRLQELDWGHWTGELRSIAYSPVVRLDRAIQGFGFAPPGGESFNAVRARALESICSAARRVSSGDVWVFTHRNLIKSVVRTDTGWTVDEILEVKVDVVSLTSLQYHNGGKLELLKFNHLTI